MEKTKNFFDKHPKLSYFVDAIITLICIFVFPAIFMPNFMGFIVGLILAIGITRILGVKWIPLNKLKSK